jgi:hypothetical protein
MDFTNSEVNNQNFLRYALDFHYQNPITDIKKHQLPQPEDLVEGVDLHTAT